MASSMLWYDLETFGIDSRHDRIAQFACIRTNERLEEIDDPVTLYCKPAMDYLPSPIACEVHGITPQAATELGVLEYDFAFRILQEFSVPATTVVGYNSIHFDDEFIRNLLYRNLFDPYSREYANGNSRWDTINLMRAAHDLRPDGIVWPQDADGTPVFKLEVLAKANGVLHESAHDALSDIRATISLARLVQTRQPRLYSWYFSHRKRESLKPLIDLAARKMLLQTASEYTSAKGCTTFIAPVGMDPANRNQLVAIDLRFNPEELISLTVEEIRQRVFAKAEDRVLPRVPLSRIKLNHCPFLAPASILNKAAEVRLGLDKELCADRLEIIARNPGLARKLVSVFDEPIPPNDSDDPDASLYSGGFVQDLDRERCTKVHALIAEARKAGAGLEAVKESCYRMKFEDERIPRLMRRLFARNFPETLGPSERLKWRDFCTGRIQLPSREGATELSDYLRLVETRLVDPGLPAPRRAVIHALLDWKRHLETEVLSWTKEGD